MSESEQPTKRYGYSIHTNQLIRPMGAITHIAKVTRMVDRQRQADIPADQFGEAWGQDEDDARRKMKGTVEAWIAAQEK
jgi:hypothetical protein